MTLATIAIPTFNRVATLPRAVTSALAQDYPAIEVVICDNASTDGTEEFCRELAGRDRRVRYVRHAENVGPIANFEAGLAAATGDYFMWLADDDWVDANYLSACIGALERGVALVAGRARWFDSEGEVLAEAPTRLLDDDGRRRIRDFFRTVTKASVYYGVSRTETARSRGPLSEATGGDWLFVAALAATGKVETLDTTSTHRSVGGASDAIVGAGWTIPGSVLRDILLAPAYADLGRRRILLALECGAIIGWRVGVWFPTLALLRRHLGDGGYERLRVRYRSVGRRRSRSEMVRVGTAGQSMAREGSSQRIPPAASGA